MTAGKRKMTGTKCYFELNSQRNHFDEGMYDQRQEGDEEITLGRRSQDKRKNQSESSKTGGKITRI